MLETPEARAKLRRKLELWPDDRACPLTINQALELLELIERLEYQLLEMEGVAKDYNKQIEWFADVLSATCHDTEAMCASCPNTKTPCTEITLNEWRELARRVIAKERSDEN